MQTTHSAIKNKGMDSIKPTSIATTQAKSKPYAHKHYLRGAQFVNKVVVDGIEGKYKQPSPP